MTFMISCRIFTDSLKQFDNFTDDNDPDHYYASWKWKGGIIDPASTNYGLFGGAAVGIATINRYNWAIFTRRFVNATIPCCR